MEKLCRIAQLEEENVQLKALVKYYEGQLKLARHRQFGASSEKSEYDQLSIFNEAEATADVNVSEPELSEIACHYRKKTRLVTDRLPENLPVEVVEHTLNPDELECESCSCKLHFMKYEKRRELVIIPAQVKIREHRRAIYACRECEKDEFGDPIIKTPALAPVIKGSFASPEAIAHIMVQKFVMASPLYRQEQEWNRQGIMISRQTMSNWLLKACEDWLEPVYDALREILLLQSVLHADETTLQVLREPDKPPQSKSYIWLYRTSGDTQCPIVLYDYQPDRKAKRPKEFLSGFAGYLHSDGYDAYHGLPEDIVVVGCFAHARRKWDEALKATPENDNSKSNIMRGKQYCDQLFELERKFAALNADEKLANRQKFSKPLFEEFYGWCESLKALPKSPLGASVKYMLRQRKYLGRYLQDGRLEISNNRAERSIKPFVIGRKNFLFANTPRGAKASAIMYSIIETAKENGIDPFKYLVYIFTRAPKAENFKNNYDVLGYMLPWCLLEDCTVGG